MPKPPEPELSDWERFIKAGRGAANSAVRLVGKTGTEAAEVLRGADKKMGISDAVKHAGANVNRKFNVAEKAGLVKDAIQNGFQNVSAATQRMADEKGVTSFVTEKIVDPIRTTSNAAFASDAAKAIINAGENLYGGVRHTIRNTSGSYLPTYDAHELLQSAKAELNYVSACILQVSPAESSQLGVQFSRAVTAKIAGAASTTALLALVAAFGHAGTGTAIAGLSGAAATSATMAWVGGLVGGGVAAGAALTGGLALVVGLAAYKLLGSVKRPFESLSELEQRIVQSSWMLAAVADAYQKQPQQFTAEVADDYLQKMLSPLYQDIAANMDLLCASLGR